jgi:hypothetical protein
VRWCIDIPPHVVFRFSIHFHFGRRIALHKYDPKDLQHAFAQATAAVAAQEQQEEGATSAKDDDAVVMTVKEKELAEAKSAGLLDLVRVDGSLSSSSSHSPGGSSTVTTTTTTSSTDDDAFCTDMTLADDRGEEENSNHEMAELDRWDKGRDDDDDAALYSDGDESDCDLL